MPSLPSLLKKLEALHRQHVQIEQEIARTEKEIVAAGKGEPKRRRKRTFRPELINLFRATVKVLVDADEPLAPREIAARLRLTPTAVNYRLQKALEAKFVVKVGDGRYRAAKDIPAL